MIRWDIYIRISLFIILFVCVLIHNEVIIINICGLGSYTKYILDLKVRNEEIYTNAIDLEIIKKYETINEIDDKYEDLSVQDKNEVKN